MKPVIPVNRRHAVLALATAAAQPAFAFEGAELYPGERALYAEAAKEGLVVSFDTAPSGPTGRSCSASSSAAIPRSR